MITLGIFIGSAAALVALVAFRQWEESRGMRLAEEKRRQLDRHAIALKRRLLADAPERGKAAASDAFHEALDRAARAGIRTTRFVERRLVRLVNMVRGRRAIIKSEQPTSSFLSDIGERKRVLRDERES